MKFFRDILARGDRTQETDDEAFYSNLTSEDADTWDSDADEDDLRLSDEKDLGTEDSADNAAAMANLAKTLLQESDRQVHREANADDVQTASEAELANLENMRGGGKEGASLSDSSEPEEDEPGVPIWELFSDAEPEAKPEAPPFEPVDDVPINEMARIAMETIGSKMPSEVKAAQQPVNEAPTGGRAKTRLLGFHRESEAETDVFALKRVEPEPEQQTLDFPVGWLVIIEGPGRGAQFTLCNGVAKVGRGADQAVQLDFGDSSISRDNHAAIAYDEEQNTFFLGHGGKANLVRLNGKPVLSTEEISDGDMIRVGETTMRFIAFCRPEFAWDLTDEDQEECA